MKRLFFMLLICVTVFLPLPMSTVKAHENAVTILSTQTAFVLSKDEPSKVVLLATYKDKSLYAYNVCIQIQDIKTNKVLMTIKPDEDDGYSPQLLICNFETYGVSQIFLGIDTGGSGGFGIFYVYSVKNLNLETLFDYEKFSDKNEYKGKYIDNYKVEITSKKTELKYIIDLSLKPKEYLNNIYDTKGKLKFVLKVDISDVNSVFPYFNSTVKKFQLMVYQRITGLYSADSLGYMTDLLNLDDGVFKSYLTMCNTFGY